MSDILESELKSACRLYSEQKAIRMEKELQFQKLARLEVTARSSKRQQVPSKAKKFLERGFVEDGVNPDDKIVTCIENETCDLRAELFYGNRKPIRTKSIYWKFSNGSPSLVE